MTRRCTIDHQRVRELHEQGLSKQVIAARLGCSTDTVKKAIMQMNGWKRRSRAKAVEAGSPLGEVDA